MTNFYTSVFLNRNDILVRGYRNGKRVQYRNTCKPYLFKKSRHNNSKYRTLQGKCVDKVEFESPSKAREEIQKYKNSLIPFYGMTQFEYPYINDNYPGQIKYDVEDIRVVNVDIEVAADEGFPSIDEADKPVTAITMSFRKKFYVFGCGDYNVKQDNVTYVKCETESHLLMKFLDAWRAIDPDVITGWNVEFFDVPYIINRITRIIDKEFAQKLSPWGILREKTITIAGRDNNVYNPLGVAILDYMQLYKKFTFVMQESYRLDHIATIELNERKIDYSEFESLLELYKNDYEKFIDYNIKDVELVDRLEDKLKLIEQAYAIAYDGKVNYPDVFGSVRMWDMIIHNHLLDKNIVIPQASVSDKTRQADGAYVKDPHVGMHDWVVSFDLNSLYPHLIMQYNISPETHVKHIGSTPSIDQIIAGEWNKYSKVLKSDNLCIAPTGDTYSKDHIGFLPSLMQSMYNDRTVWKQRMLEAKQKYEKEPSYELEKTIAQCNNMQMAKKIQLNSAYGALGNQYFRWFDLKYAESITKGGQLSIKWMETKINIYLNKLLDTTDVDYVLAVDTDSMYLKLDDLVTKAYPNHTINETINWLDKVCKTQLEPYIDKSYKELSQYVNAYDQKMVMKRENIANKAIWTAKKRYIMNVFDSEGVRYVEPKLKMMGIEAVRSSTPAACRLKIKECINVIINDGEEAAVKFIEDFREQFKTLSFDDVAFPRGCKGILKYTDSAMLYKKGTPIHVRGALVYNKMLKDNKLSNKFELIREGDKIKFCYLLLPNPSRENIISVSSTLPNKFGLHKYIDFNTQFEKSFLEPIKTIMNAIGWNIEKQQTLDSFFV